MNGFVFPTWIERWTELFESSFLFLEFVLFCDLVTFSFEDLELNNLSAMELVVGFIIKFFKPIHLLFVSVDDL